MSNLNLLIQNVIVNESRDCFLIHNSIDLGNSDRSEILLAQMLTGTLLFPVLLFSSFFYGFIYACALTHDDEGIVALSLPIALAVFSFCALVSLFLGVDYYPTSHLLAVALPVLWMSTQARRISLCHLYALRFRSLVSYVKRHPGLFAGYGLLFVYYLSQQALVPFYGLGNLPGDWFGHYRITQEFLSQTVPTFPLRLPLYHLLQVFGLSVFGEDTAFGANFYLFQIGQLVVAMAMLPVVNLLFGRLFGKRNRLPILLATAILPYMVIQSLYTWPKMLAALFALLAFAFYLNLKNDSKSKRNLLVCGLFNGLSIASHWLGLVYLAAMLLDFARVNLLSSSPQEGWLSASFKMNLIALLVLAPIYLWGILQFGMTETLYATWSLLEKSEYTVLEHLLIRVLNFFTTLFLPLSILIGVFRELPQLGFTKLGNTDLLARGFSWHLGSLSGNMGVAVTIFWLSSFMKRIKSAGKASVWEGIKRSDTLDVSLAVYIIGGGLLWVLVQSYPHTYGLSFTGLTPSVILLFALVLSKIENRKRLKYLLTLFFLESLLVTWGWQGALHYLQATYEVQTQVSDPALLLLNEVIQYRSQYDLRFLSEAIRVSKVFPAGLAMMSAIGVFVLLLHAIRNKPTGQ